MRPIATHKAICDVRFTSTPARPWRSNLAFRRTCILALTSRDFRAWPAGLSSRNGIRRLDRERTKIGTRGDGRPRPPRLLSLCGCQDRLQGLLAQWSLPIGAAGSQIRAGNRPARPPPSVFLRLPVASGGAWQARRFSLRRLPAGPGAASAARVRAAAVDYERLISIRSAGADPTFSTI